MSEQDLGVVDVAAAPALLAVGAWVLGQASLDRAAAAAGMTTAEVLDEVRDRIAAATAGAEESRPELSVVIPVLNEEEGIEGLLDRIVAVLEPLVSFEVIVVDDGSTDATLSLVRSRHERDARVKVASFTRNFGHQAALLAGLRHATGSAIVMMDADGQDPPELLPELIARWRDGFEVVYGVRRERKESFWKRVGYSSFYRLLYRMAELPIPTHAGDFCLMDRQVVDAMAQLPESTRFLRGLRSWVGYRQVGLEYDRPAREHGETKYPFTKLVRLAFEGLLSFSSFPLRLASLLGFATSMAGTIYLAFAIVARAFSGSVPAGWTSVVCIVLLIGGAQLLMIGVLGEYLARVYAETKRRPAYVLRAFWK